MPYHALRPRSKTILRSISIVVPVDEHQLIEHACAVLRMPMREFLMRQIRPAIKKLRKERLKRERSVATLATDAGSYSVTHRSSTMAAAKAKTSPKAAPKAAAKAKTPAKAKRTKA